MLEGLNHQHPFSPCKLCSVDHTGLLSFDLIAGCNDHIFIVGMSDDHLVQLMLLRVSNAVSHPVCHHLRGLPGLGQRTQIMTSKSFDMYARLKGTQFTIANIEDPVFLEHGMNAGNDRNI